jgi:hypothetical protein
MVETNVWRRIGNDRREMQAAKSIDEEEVWAAQVLPVKQDRIIWDCLVNASGGPLAQASTMSPSAGL